jgi:formylglycine-generating enzyme required for sulfatase activity
VCWEANLVYNDLYNLKISTSKYVPIVFSATDAQHIPPVLQGRTHFCLDPDQFEQWLQGRSEEDYGALSAALQACDGARLQCLLLIRDNFWTPLTRFLRHVQVRMEEGKNAVMVDLFDKRHALPDESLSEASKTSSADAQPLYRLTHDDLAPSIREWLAKLQRLRGQHWRGRAELRLEQLIARWQVEHDRRFLPGPLEFLTILLGVSWTRHRPEQRRLMRTASRWYASFAALAVLVLAVVWFAVREGRGHIAASGAMEPFFRASEFNNASEFLQIIHNEAHRHRPWLRRRLELVVEQQPEDAFKAAERVRLGTQRADAAIALWYLGDPRKATDVLKVDKDPESLTQFVHRCKQRGMQAGDLWDGLIQASDTTVRYGLLLTLTEFERAEIPDSQRKQWGKQLADWHANDPKSAIHSACGWQLRHWGEDKLADDVDQKPLACDPQREWFVTEVKYSEDDNAEKDYFTFIVFPPGLFIMGSPEHEGGRFDDETLREVQIEQPFALCDREVTNAQYRRFVASRNGDEGAYTGKRDLPAVNMCWNDAVEYCQWLERFGVRVRLPSEREWEYACRAGTITPFSHGSDVALLQNYARCYSSPTEERNISRCGALWPNPRGLFDIHGNVLEWCSDQDGEWAGDRVIRGGSWLYGPLSSRSAYRGSEQPSYRHRVPGFRVAAVLPGQASQFPEDCSAEPKAEAEGGAHAPQRSRSPFEPERKTEHAADSEPPNP